jgi:ABC-type branched-subunit amino acid transport system substrate-binding protein
VPSRAPGADKFVGLSNLGTGPTDGDPTRLAAMGARFNARFGRFPAPGSQSSNAYDAVNAYWAAITAPPRLKTDGESLALALRGVSLGSAGVSGPVAFDAQGDVSGGYTIWTVDGGATVALAPNVAP